MEINELKTFIAVATFGSFSVAAERLFLSQPAISKRIASLESSLNSKLFDRIGHQVSLTEAGKSLLPGAEAILLELEDLKKSITNLSGDTQGKLSLGASHHVGLRRLPPILKQFSKQFPQVDLDISFMDSEQAHSAVLSGEIELATVTISTESKDRIKAIKIWDDNLHIVVANDHILAQSNNITLEDLSLFKAILPSEKTFTRRIVETKFKEKKIPIQAAMNTNYIETIRMMVAIGMGWSALPETMIASDLKIIKIDGLNLRRSLGCIYHKERTLSNAAKALIALLKSKQAALL